MTEKKPGEPKCYQYGPNPMVCAVHGHYSGCTVWREEIESRARRAGAREALERAAEIIKPHVKCDCRGTASSFSDSRSVGQEHWGDCLLRIYDAIRALADQPEAEKDAPDRYVECPGCSRAGGAERAIYHEPPVCAESPQAPAKVLPPCDSNASKAEILYNHELRLVQLEENAFGGPAHPNPPARVMPLEAKADALPLDHPFQPCPTPGHCEDYGERFCHRPFCSAPEAAHGRK